MAYGDFGDIRELLHRTPHRGVWEQLCAEVRLWSPERFEDQVLPYALARLERWPDALREVRPEWTRSLLRGRAKGAHFTALARVLHLNTEPDDAHDLDDLAACDWRALRHVEVTDIVSASSTCARLAREPWFHQVRRLRARPAQGNTSLDHAIAEGNLSGLEELHIESNRLHEDFFFELAAAEWPRLRTLRMNRCHFWTPRGSMDPLHTEDFAPHLTTFDFSENELNEHAMEELARAPWMAHVERLRIDESRRSWRTSGEQIRSLMALLLRADLSSLRELGLLHVPDVNILRSLSLNQTCVSLETIEMPRRRGDRHLRRVLETAIEEELLTDAIRAQWARELAG